MAGRSLFNTSLTFVLLGASCKDTPSLPPFLHHHPHRQHHPTWRVAAMVDHRASDKGCAGSGRGCAARYSFFFFSFIPTSLRRRSRCRRHASLRCSLPSERCSSSESAIILVVSRLPGYCARPSSHPFHLHHLYSIIDQDLCYPLATSTSSSSLPRFPLSVGEVWLSPTSRSTAIVVIDRRRYLSCLPCSQLPSLLCRRLALHCANWRCAALFAELLRK